MTFLNPETKLDKIGMFLKENSDFQNFRQPHGNVIWRTTVWHGSPNLPGAFNFGNASIIDEIQCPCRMQMKQVEKEQPIIKADEIRQSPCGVSYLK